MSKVKIHLSDLADQMAGQTSFSKKQAEDFLKTLFDVIEETLLNNDSLKIPGLGSFKLQWVAERKSVDVNTGADIIIDGYNKVSFTPDADLKELVNAPFAHLESVNLSEPVPVVKEVDSSTEGHELFAEQASEIKEILTEIDSLSKKSNQEDQIETVNDVAASKDEEQSILVEAEPEVSTPQTVASETPLKSIKQKPKRKGVPLLLMLIVGMVAGAALFYVLFHYNLIPTRETETPVVLQSTSEPELVVDSLLESTMMEDTLIASEPVDTLQLLFDATRSYTEFIGREKVVAGSRLTRIAERHYGVKEFWVYIYEANRDKLRNPNAVEPGMVLLIPALNPVLANPESERCMNYARELHDVYLLH